MLSAIDHYPRFSLLAGPTPIERLVRLEKVINLKDCPQIYVKRDDLMGVGGGGNKLRKLEFLLGEARAQGCDTFITTGGHQSNHARLSAAASNRARLACEIVLTDVVPRHDEVYQRNGNVLLDHLFGAVIHHRGGDVDALAVARDRAEELATKGRKVYVVGSGGSSPVGCLGYVSCAREIKAQEAELGLRFSRIIVPNGSSGTHAGLAAGFKAMSDAPARLRSFAVLAPHDKAEHTTHKLANEVLTLLDLDQLDKTEISISGSQLGEAYGVPTEAMFEAVRLIARSEGLLLDPVYSGKAFAGLLADIRDGMYQHDEAVLFIMTGVTPGRFAYETAFRDRLG